jgi:hypothetical protein
VRAFCLEDGEGGVFEFFEAGEEVSGVSCGRELGDEGWGGRDGGGEGVRMGFLVRACWVEVGFE